MRFEFVRSAPDIVAFLVALRSNLTMKVVIPEVLPTKDVEPYMSTARFEVGQNGNPHWHCFGMGSDAPRIGRVRGSRDTGLRGDVPEDDSSVAPASDPGEQHEEEEVEDGLPESIDSALEIKRLRYHMRRSGRGEFFGCRALR